MKKTLILKDIWVASVSFCPGVRLLNFCQGGTLIKEYLQESS